MATERRGSGAATEPCAGDVVGLWAGAGGVRRGSFGGGLEDLVGEVAGGGRGCTLSR